MHTTLRKSALLTIAFSICSVGIAGAVTIDFTTDDFGNALVNGQDISTPPEFGNLLAISSAGGGHLGPAIFNSNNPGPNVGGGDPDLLVNLGNILILQSTDSPTQTVPGIFDTPNDEAGGGTIIFDFLSPILMESIDLIDINGANQAVMLTLIDGSNLTRVFDVPDKWTQDISVSGPPGFGTLDLTTLANQPGFQSTATATEDGGFDPTGVVRMEVEFMGSAGLDNLNFVPEPTSFLLLGFGGMGLLRRKR